jgi:hypothetical protein
MDGQNILPNQSNQQFNKNVSYPDQIRDQAQQIASTIKMLMEIPKSISTLRRVFRGEALYQSDDGTTEWIQVVKPMFIKLDPYTRQPITQFKSLPNGEKRNVFLPNDEAIEEILSQLFFMGMNDITPLTNLDENNVLDDLKEFECKLAGILCLKQVAWGLDKAYMPMIQTKIKTIVQDARYLCVNGGTMKALTQQVSRIENVLEGDKTLQKKMMSSYSS